MLLHFKNKILFIKSDTKHVLFAEIWLLVLKNNYLFSIEVVGIERYFLASCIKVRKLSLWFIHQINGLSLTLIFSNFA